MRRRMKWWLMVITMTTFLNACRDEYDPMISSMEESYLVVDGNINIGPGATSYFLSRTFKLDDSARLRGEEGAYIAVEDENNVARQLFPTGGGHYSAFLNLEPNRNYRLRIRTTDDREYVSAFVAGKRTPDIESLEWDLTPDGLRVLANTSDPSGNTLYYRWEYEETWEIHSGYYSRYIYNRNTNTIRERNLPAEQIYYCWKNAFSSNIILASSARLQTDVIFQAPVKFIPNGDERLGVRYSILVKQYALEKDAYEYLELMKKNTESLGTIFDPQPTELIGNIECVSHPQEAAIGFVTACSMVESRMFITGSEVPNWGFSMFCDFYPVPNNPDSLEAYFSSQYSPFESEIGLTGDIEFYLGSTPACVDCTTRGGSTNRPSFW